MNSSKKYKIKKGKTRKIKKTDAYVINLDEATERWDKIQKDFKDTNIHLIRVSAVKNIEKPKQGLLDSFKKIVTIAKEKNLKSVLILEDDSYPTENFNKRWATTKKWLDTNMDKWELFNGGVLLFWFNKIKTNKDTELKSNINLYKSNRIFSNNFLYVNKNCYDKFLNLEHKIMYDDYIEENKRSVDHYTGDSEHFNSIYIYPQLAKQHNGHSYLDNNTDKIRSYDDIDNYFKNNNFDLVNKNTSKKTNDAYVINLDEATERWNKIQKDFKDTNLNLIRFPAIKHTSGREGILLSYQNLIKMAKEKKMKRILILEDDSYPLEKFNERWELIKKWLDKNMDKWEIFNGSIQYCKLYKSWKLEDTKSEIYSKINKDTILYKTNFTCHCNFLYINSSIYDKILSWKLDSTKFALDFFTGDLSIVNCIHTWPNLVYQGDNFSSIEKQYKKNVKRNNDYDNYMNKYIKTLEK